MLKTNKNHQFRLLLFLEGGIVMSKKNSIKITTQITKTGRIRVKTTTTHNGHITQHLEHIKKILVRIGRRYYIWLVIQVLKLVKPLKH